MVYISNEFLADSFVDMLLGIGVSGMFVTWSTGEDILLESSPTLMMSLGGVLFAIAGAAVVVPRSGYRLCRWWGFFLVGVYVASMAVNVALEVRMTADNK